MAKVSSRRRKELRKPDEFVTITMKMGEWIREHQRLVVFASAFVVIVVVAVALTIQLMTSSRVRHSEELWSAIATASAPVVDPDDEEHEIPDRVEHYKTEADRTKAAVSAFQKVIKAQGTTTPAQLARLGLASEKLSEGDYAEARKLYESFLGDTGGFDQLKAFAVEGVGYCFEGQKNYDRALDEYRELEKLDDGVHADLAKYHQARMLEKMNKNQEAADLYRGIVRRSEQATDEMVTNLFVRDRSESRLAVLDPGSELLKRSQKGRGADLLKQLLNRGGAGGAGGAKMPSLPRPPSEDEE